MILTRIEPLRLVKLNTNLANSTIHRINSESNDKNKNTEIDLLNRSCAELFTDASASPYGGVACLGWIKKGNLQEVRFSLIESQSMSVQFLEAKAIAYAILRNSSNKIIHVYSDSKAAINIIETALAGNDCGIASSFLGFAIVEDLIRIARNHKIKFEWVKAHQDNDWNVLCDQIVRYGRNVLKEGTDISKINNSAKTVLKEMMRVRGLS